MFFIRNFSVSFRCSFELVADRPANKEEKKLCVSEIEREKKNKVKKEKKNIENR